MKTLRTIAMLMAVATLPVVAQKKATGNPQVGDYGYLNCHMSDFGEWTAYALSTDGIHYHDLLGGDSIFSATEHARIEGGTRDAYICRKHDNSGYLMVTTDMQVKSEKRLKKPETWCNFGIDLYTSPDLINWTSVTFDFRKGPKIFCDPASPSVYKDWSKVVRVWAPQIFWDSTYRWPDGKQGGYLVYFSMLNRAEEAYDRCYYSYADESFTRLTQPKLLFDWGYATIDADINYLESDGRYHMMIKKEGGTPGIFASVSDHLLGPWPAPSDEDHIKFEGKLKCEGPSAYPAPDGTWFVAYQEYSSRPHRYRICRADKYMKKFYDPQDIQGVRGPQHGSFLRLTKEEYFRLEHWSNVTMAERLKDLNEDRFNLDGEGGKKAQRRDENGINDTSVDQYKKGQDQGSPYARPVAGSSRQGTNPVLFLVGNSTMRTGTKGNGDNGQWGWGFFAHEWFDESRISVENHALGGTSSRTFYNDLWPDVLKGVQAGDYVIIELGHNDNGPLDTWTARNSIRGIDPDTVAYVTLHDCRNKAWDGRQDTVVSYGEYMRRYIREVRAKGAFPIIASLTPRNAWDDARTITRKTDTFTKWGRQVAIEMQCPWIDLEGESARRLEHFGHWKTNGMFTTLDKIHTSAMGAQNNAYAAALAIKNCLEPDPIAMGAGYQPLRNYLKDLTLPTVDVRRQKGKPVVFITGDSTVKIDGDSPMVGWGQLAGDVFNTDVCTPVNCAKAGRSTRTFMREGRWEQVYNSVQEGDIVLIQFGHNDIGEIGKGKDRGTLPYGYDTAHVYTRAADGVNELVHSFGWYLRRFISDVREKGGIPVLVSLTPRNEWPDGEHIERRNDSYGRWYRQVVDSTGVAFIDLHNLTADTFDAMGRETVASCYSHDHTHNSLRGARHNAVNVAKALRQLGFGQLVRSDEYLDIYCGLQATVDLKQDITAPTSLHFDVPDGNYRVTLTLGNRKKAGETVVRAENRRLLIDRAVTRKRETQQVTFTVNKRTPQLRNGGRVSIKPREAGYNTWNQTLDLELAGTPAVSRIEVAPDTVAHTIYLCGNSTVTDQPYEPWSSWGQMFPVWFDERVAISNHAESGLTARTFIAGHRLDQVCERLKKGDLVICEFGHNDEKEHQPGDGPWTHYIYNLQIMVDRVRKAGADVVFCTPTARRNFVGDRIKDTHGEFPAAMKQLASRLNVPVIDLTTHVTHLYETLGPEGSKQTLVHYAAGTFPGQDKDLADNTHFNPYGAYEVAKMVVQGLVDLHLPISEYLRLGWQTYNPTKPDDPKAFVWFDAPSCDTAKPDGN